MEVWWVRPDGGVHGAYFLPNLSPQWPKYPLTPPGAASKNTPFAALTLDPNEMELWWIRPDGVVWDAYYL